MFDWAIGGLGALFGWIGDAAGAAAGWAWDKVITGIYGWLAKGLALMIEWVWSVLDSATTPRVTAGWFQNDLAVRVGVLGLATTIAMMLLSAAQAALAGRPEQITDLLKESVKSIAASAFTITVLDVLIGVTDEASAFVWRSGRPDLIRMIEGLVAVATVTGPLATTFVGPLALLFGFIGLLGLVVSLMMRSALIYVVAALAPIVWSLGVLPSFRGSSRKLVHLGVSLVLSKLAIVITLVVAVKLISHPVGDPNSGALINDGAAAVGTLMAGFICFLVAAVTPMVLYKLMPAAEGAMVGSGVASGWTRGVTTAAHTGLMVKSLGASAGVSAATRAVGGQAGVAGVGAAATGGGSGGGSAPSPGGSSGGPEQDSLGSMGRIANPAGSASNGGESGSTAPPHDSSTSPSRPVAQPPGPPDGDREDDREQDPAVEQ
jgi:type IV secretion system protein TrbL